MTQRMIEFFHVEKNRLKTFSENIPQNHTSFAVSLSRNGFIFTGERYVCIFCLKHIQRININDDVLKRHFKLSKSCNIFTNGLNVPINDEMFKEDDKLYRQMKLADEKAQRVHYHIKKKMKSMTPAISD